MQQNDTNKNQTQLLREHLEWAREEFRETLKHDSELEAEFDRLIQKGRDLEALARHVKRAQIIVWVAASLLAATVAMIVLKAL